MMAVKNFTKCIEKYPYLSLFAVKAAVLHSDTCVSVFIFRNFLEQLFVRAHPEESYRPCNNFTHKKV